MRSASGERRVLLIDDDQGLASLLGDFLRPQGYLFDWAESPSKAREILASPPDLILLDVMLPEMDGFAFCRLLREEGHRTPVIMLTARGDDRDRIQGLRLGADDYLPKPFNPVELVARIEAVLRRSPAPLASRDGLDADQRALRLGRRIIPLTPTEYRLLEGMTAQPGRVFTRAGLLDLLDEAGAIDTFDRAIDIHVSRLRGKLEPDPRQPVHLLTVRGVGYRFAW